MVEREGFEPSKAYAARFTVWSLWPLGYLSDISIRVVITHFSKRPKLLNHQNPKYSPFSCTFCRKNGAETGTRTLDLRFTKPLLYQLSYPSAELKGLRKGRREFHRSGTQRANSPIRLVSVFEGNFQISPEKSMKYKN